MFDFLLTDDKNKILNAQVITTNGFALTQEKSLQIYFFCVKHQAKHDFLKYIKSRVVYSHSSLYSK